MNDIITDEQALDFIKARLAYLQSLHWLDMTSQDRSEKRSLELRMPSSPLFQYDAHYRHSEVYVPDEFFPRLSAAA